ncbi:hypothetical protein Hanom_Chr05g00397431 [Helianthus anomalus]
MVVKVVHGGGGGARLWRRCTAVFVPATDNHTHGLFLISSCRRSAEGGDGQTTTAALGGGDESMIVFADGEDVAR